MGDRKIEREAGEVESKTEMGGGVGNADKMTQSDKKTHLLSNDFVPGHIINHSKTKHKCLRQAFTELLVFHFQKRVLC